MSSNLVSFIKENINNSTYVNATKLDKTLKQIINTYLNLSNTKEKEVKRVAIEYINIL